MRGKRGLTDTNLLKEITSPSSPHETSTVWQGEAMWAVLTFLKTRDKITNASRDKHGSFKGMGLTATSGQLWEAEIDALPNAERLRNKRTR